MNIAIPNFNNIRIKTGINNSSVYNAYQKCIINDKSLLPSNGKVPTIWNISRAIDGEKYNTGDAVWINTENEREFVKSNEHVMYEYVNERIPGKIRTLSGDYSALIDFYVDVLNNKVSGIESPYYIGKITEPVQIRISRIDNNQTRPDNSTYWYDFWERDNDDKNKKIIKDECLKISNDKLRSHKVNYHLYGNENNIDNYLKTDLSNVKYKQDYKTHYYFDKTSGFDFVKLTIQKNFNNNCFKWFKLWNSGFLEHGGIIDTNTENLIGNDSQEYGGTCHKVALNWDFDSRKAPVYDYEIGGINSFYNIYTSFKFSNNNEKTYDINNSGMLYLTYRYNIQVTPIFNKDINPFDSNNNIEINTIRNSSFCFQKNQNARFYSYYTSGMTYSNVRKY